MLDLCWERANHQSCFRVSQTVFAPEVAPSPSGKVEPRPSSGGSSAPLTRHRKKTGKLRIRRQASDENPEPHLERHRRQHKEKDEATRQLIKAGMKQDRICGVLEDGSLETILEHMDFFEFAPGDLIVEQGKMGNTFFVIHSGTAEVSVNDKVCNTLSEGVSFGGIAVLYHAPRTATVRATSACSIWGANGKSVHQVMQEAAVKNYAENRKFLSSIELFGSLTDEQKNCVSEVCNTEMIRAGARVMTEGDTPAAIYFVKKGKLQVFKGGSVNSAGALVGGTELSNLWPGDCFGERALLHKEPRTATVVAQENCELLTISICELQEIMGGDLGVALERNLLLLALKRSPRYSQFSAAQQFQFVKNMEIRDFPAGAKVEEEFQFAIIINGQLSGEAASEKVVLERGQCYEDGYVITDEKMRPLSRKPSEAVEVLDQQKVLQNPRAGADKGVRMGVLTKKGLAIAMSELGLGDGGNHEEAADCARRMMMVRKVYIFRHLSDEQIARLVKAFAVQKYGKGTVVIKQGEVASSFFVIASGEVTVTVNGEKKRTMARNAYLGERALLFDEPRSATITVSSQEAELWCVDKKTFLEIVSGMMQQELMNRIRLQDTDMTLKDLKTTKVIGTGAAGVVRLVKHKTTGMRYALKRVHKQRGKVPEEVRRECDLLAENDHPFIITLVKTFETDKSVYMLQELLTGGELHDAIRRIPTVLSRSQSQFYTGSLVIIIEELADRNIVYRDLKPENVMLDSHGYLKLIDFGIAKKLEEGKKTFTMVGTPHYMAPEVMRSSGYGTEVDLWSLGVMLYEFVCGYLPFADDLDDPSEVCRAVLKEPLQFPSRYRDEHGRALMQGLLCRQPKRRLGAGINRFEDVRNASYFKVGHDKSNLFNKIMGRELDPPVLPKGEVYCSNEDVQAVQAHGLSDEDQLG